ncbi:MAG: GreA/GreB family elongation factor [Caldilineaceae bacterium]
MTESTTKKILITKEGYQKLSKQLEELQTVKRPAALHNLQDVSNSADWRDNAQLIQMQNNLGIIDAEIHRLEKILEEGEIVAPQSNDAVVDIGETVVLQCDGDMETYTIVSPAESDPDHGYISYESPLGHALLKQKVGDEVDVQVPAGLLHYRIVAVQ